MKKTLTMVIALLCVFSFVSCAENSAVVGKWYNSDGRCLDVISDGSWKLEDSYGTGTWKKLGDGIFEFTDFYGDTQESAISKDDNGEYIDFGYLGNFYKTNPYENQNSTIPQNSMAEAENETEIDPEFKRIDPFEGISYFVSGISPYCEISVNNQNCSIEAQNYVTYKFDKEEYSNGETAIITASLSDLSYESEYILTSFEHTFKIENQPEYIISLESIDISLLESELQDNIDSQCSAALGVKHAFGENLYAWSFDDRIVADIKTSLQEKYFSSLKLMRMDLMNSETPFNRLSFIYKINITASDNSTETLYVNISALNIVKYTDGSIKWGTISTDAFDFTRVTYRSSLEECVANTITAYKTNYNISKID